MHDADEHPHDQSGPTGLPESTPDEPVRTVHSDELLQGARELFIRHADDLYRLRVTRNGKLILQK